MHRGMSYARLATHGGLQWPCPDEDTVGPTYLHGRLWEEPLRGPRAGFHPVVQKGPSEALTDAFPLRLTTGRRLDAYNTGVQSGPLASPMRRETIDLHPDDARRLGVSAGERVRVCSKRGSVIAPVAIDPGLQPGLVFMTFHDPAAVETNLLTVDAWDPKSGTAEFKAAAVRIEKLERDASDHAAE
jgi:formate dehydrogenase major subunit